MAVFSGGLMFALGGVFIPVLSRQILSSGILLAELRVHILLLYVNTMKMLLLIYILQNLGLDLITNPLNLLTNLYSWPINQEMVRNGLNLS